MSGRDRNAVPMKPRGLRASVLHAGTDRIAVLSYPTEGSSTPPEPLSEAELDVFRRILSGETNAAIAEARGTSSRTVANQVAALYRKLGVGSRAELIRLVSATPR